MPVLKEQVLHIAQLSKLNLSKAEIEDFTRELTSITDYFKQLEQVKTDGVECRAFPAGHELFLRDDTIRSSLPRELALVNAPNRDEEFFCVPKVFEQ